MQHGSTTQRGPVGHTYSSLAAKAPMPDGSPPDCHHEQVDWEYVVEDRGPVSVLEGDCVQCGDTVRGTQERPNGEITSRERVY